MRKRIKEWLKKKREDFRAMIFELILEALSYTNIKHIYINSPVKIVSSKKAVITRSFFYVCKNHSQYPSVSMLEIIKKDRKRKAK